MQKPDIAQKALEHIQANIMKLGVSHVKQVALRVDGKKIRPDTLKNELVNYSMNTIFKNTRWVVKEMKIRAICKKCGGQFEFSPHQDMDYCKYCTSSKIERIEKDSFEIIGIVI